MAKDREELELIEDGEQLVLEEPAAPRKKDKREQRAPKKEKKPAGRFRKRIGQTFSELKKVSWPGFREVVKKTGVVLIVVASFLLVIYGVDTLLSLGLGAITGTGG